MNINELVQGLDNPKLRDAVMRLGNTPEGQKLLHSLTPGDKEQLLRQLGGLNANGVTTDMLLRKLNNDPDILNKLSQLVSKKR